MIEKPRYAHTNLVARNWQALADFYQSVFGCEPVPPQRVFAGPDLEAGTGVPGSTLRGIHLRLPGYSSDGPTLEIFTYSRLADGPLPAVNRPGFGHIAFAVASVPDARAEVLRAGGGVVGDIVTLTTATGARVTWCYVTDPEENVVELQSWNQWLLAGLHGARLLAINDRTLSGVTRRSGARVEPRSCPSGHFR